MQNAKLVHWGSALLLAVGLACGSGLTGPQERLSCSFYDKRDRFAAAEA